MIVKSGIKSHIKSILQLQFFHFRLETLHSEKLFRRVVKRKCGIKSSQESSSRKLLQMTEILQCCYVGGFNTGKYLVSSWINQIWHFCEIWGWRFESDLTFPPCPDAPKLTFISRAAEQQRPDGRSSVMLHCSCHCFPPASHYFWFKRGKDDPESRGTLVSTHQNFTVYSDMPGYYYCSTRNEMGERSSDSVLLFVEG